jgi:hypothetical protein
MVVHVSTPSTLRLKASSIARPGPKKYVHKYIFCNNGTLEGINRRKEKKENGRD